MSLRRTFNDLGRLRHILQVLAKYGFGYVVDKLNIERSIFGREIRFLGSIRRATLVHLPVGVRLRRVCEELGPTFIKFGQIVSLHPDFITIDVARELARLQDTVPPYPFPAVQKEIERDLKQPLNGIFQSITPSPKASASLAQVHEAVLRDGREVIVKVQRPGLERIIAADMDILYELARLADRYVEEIRVFDLVGLVDEFRRNITKELDFRNEAANIDRFQIQFQGDPTVKIPAVFHEFSGKTVLTLEKITGLKITDIAAIEEAGLDRARIAKNGAAALLKQVFTYGFFHGDPHPGNVLILPGNRIAFLDFGMVGRLSPSMKNRLVNILINLVQRNVMELREAVLQLGMPVQEVSTSALDMDIDDYLWRYYDKPFNKIDVGQAFMDLIDIAAKYRVRLPSDLYLLGRVLVTIEGEGKQLDGNFNMVEEARPFVEELQRQRYSLRAVGHAIRLFVVSLSRFAHALPQDLNDILQKLKHGTLQITFEHRGLEDISSHITRASNRIAMSLILSSLIVGSSILLHAGIGPKYWGFPVLGLVGFVMAGIMGIWLIIVIVSSGER